MNDRMTRARGVYMGNDNMFISKLHVYSRNGGVAQQ